MSEKPLVVLGGNSPKQPNSNHVFVNRAGAELLRDTLNKLLEGEGDKHNVIFAGPTVQNGNSFALVVHLMNHADFDCGGAS